MNGGVADEVVIPRITGEGTALVDAGTGGEGIGEDTAQCPVGCISAVTKTNRDPINGFSRIRSNHIGAVGIDQLVLHYRGLHAYSAFIEPDGTGATIDIATEGENRIGRIIGIPRDIGQLHGASSIEFTHLGGGDIAIGDDIGTHTGSHGGIGGGSDGPVGIRDPRIPLGRHRHIADITVSTPISGTSAIEEGCCLRIIIESRLRSLGIGCQ